MSKGRKTRFSDYFKLKKSQYELDFVDIPIETDIPLYVDPYALHISNLDWLRECGNNVVGYFELLIAKIRAKDNKTVLQLLDNFHEPNETHLGLSSGTPSGRGWGATQSSQLLSILRNSNAVRSGKLQDLGDYEMFIPGIGPDKISDLATNIIKSDLITYTTEQCQLHSIETQNVNVGKIWEPAAERFESRYVALPICSRGPLILVPKLAVRTRLAPDHDRFYSQFVLQYLEAELVNANDSLVTVLKNGKRKVYKKDLREKYQMSREELYDFTQRHPEVLKSYKESLPNETRPISDLDIERRQAELREFESQQLIDALGEIPKGPRHASAYHELILGILSAVFYPMLSRPVKEQEINEGRKRIDIKFDNADSDGFFSHLVHKHKVEAPYIFVECKNYSEDPANPELDQLGGRFGRHKGHFGLLVCREVENPQLMKKRCRDLVNSKSDVILVLEDRDMVKLIKVREAEGSKGVSDYMHAKLDEIFLG